MQDLTMVSANAVACLSVDVSLAISECFSPNVHCLLPLDWQSLLRNLLKWEDHPDTICCLCYASNSFNLHL